MKAIKQISLKWSDDVIIFHLMSYYMKQCAITVYFIAFEMLCNAKD